MLRSSVPQKAAGWAAKLLRLAFAKFNCFEPHVLIGKFEIAVIPTTQGYHA